MFRLKSVRVQEEEPEWTLPNIYWMNIYKEEGMGSLNHIEHTLIRLFSFCPSKLAGENHFSHSHNIPTLLTNWPKPAFDCGNFPNSSSLPVLLTSIGDEKAL